MIPKLKKYYTKDGIVIKTIEIFSATKTTRSLYTANKAFGVTGV